MVTHTHTHTHTQTHTQTPYGDYSIDVHAQINRLTFNIHDKIHGGKLSTYEKF